MERGEKVAQLTYDYLFFRLMRWMSVTDVLYCISYMSSIMVAFNNTTETITEIDDDDGNIKATGGCLAQRS